MVSKFRREDHALFLSCAHAILPQIPADRQGIARQYPERDVVWVTKYRYNVLQGSMRERIREIIRQTCDELGVHIVRGVLARDHVHMFLSIPPKLSLFDVMQRIKGRSSRRIQMEFPDLRKRYWGRRFLFSGMLRIPCQAVGRAGTSRPRPEM